MPIHTQPLADHIYFGAIITGLRPDELVDDGIRSALYDLWIDRGVLVFRGLPDEADVQIQLSQVFGEPAAHPLKQTLDRADVHKLADIFYDPDRGDIVDIGGSKLGAWLPWHFDLAYVAHINHGGILRGCALPTEGGQTGFLDGIEAYERLPNDLREEIANLWVVYRFDGDLAGLRYGATPGVTLDRMSTGAAALMKRIDMLPPAAHPLVYTQAETGRQVLNFSPWFALGIEGMDRDRADAILHRVAAIMVDERRAYFHDWQSGDMVLWDNWRLLHCARGIPFGHKRHMQRTTIAGDYGHGRPAKWSEPQRLRA